jgi:hypothetical protein
MRRSLRSALGLLALTSGCLRPALAQQPDSVRADSSPVTVYRVQRREFYTRRLPAPPAVHDTVWLHAAADTVPTCTPGPLVLCPSDSLQAKVTAAGTGAGFTVGPGVFPFASITPLANQSFVGFDSLTVFSGARTLTGWQSDGAGHWYVGGQTQHNTQVNVFSCAKLVLNGPGTDSVPALCGQPEQLWINGVRQEPRDSLKLVRAGQWFFDYATDRIYLPADPGTDTVATSVTVYAFQGSAANVRIAHLTLERYANAAQTGCIAGTPGPLTAGWKVDTTELRECHGFGVRVTGTGPRLAGNWSHDNGEGGGALLGTNSRSLGNRWKYNNTAHFGPGAVEEAAGLKIMATTDALVDGDTAIGNGLNNFWTDVAALRTTIQNSVGDSADGIGFLAEVSYQIKLLNNRACYNGRHTGTYAVAGAGIVVSNSPDVEVAGNTVCGNRGGILAYETARSAPPNYLSTLGPHDVVRLRVHGNIITQLDNGRAAGIANDATSGSNPYTTAADNRWFGNTYHRTLGTTKWRWTGNADVSETAWRAAQDSASTFGP